MVTINQRLKLNQNTIRKTVILLMTLALVVTSIGAATAKGKPSTAPVYYYDVTMDLEDGDEGLATDETCRGDVPLHMRFEESRSGSRLIADGTELTSMPRLSLQAEVPWSRTDPEPDSADRFDGCHGGPLPESGSDIPSYFAIQVDRSGNAVSILWAFDVYTEEGTRDKNNKTPGVKEYFRLWSTDEVTFQVANGNDCPLDSTVAVTCTVSGPFEVWHYPIEQLGTANFDFALTIQPHTEPHTP